MPDVGVDKVAEISGVDAFDIVCVDRREVVIVLTCFLLRNDNDILLLFKNRNTVIIGN